MSNGRLAKLPKLIVQLFNSLQNIKIQRLTGRPKDQGTMTEKTFIDKKQTKAVLPELNLMGREDNSLVYICNLNLIKF